MPTSDSTVRAALSALAERARTKLEHREKVLAEWPEARGRLARMEGDKPPRGPRSPRAPTRAELLAKLGDLGHCEVCKKPFNLSVRVDPRCIEHRHDNDVIRGLTCRRCNRDLATLDLRFHDPERFLALMAFSLRGEPVVPTGRKRATRKRIKPSEPALFKSDE